MDSWPESADIPLGPAPGVQLQYVRQNLKEKQAEERSVKGRSPTIEQPSHTNQDATQSATKSSAQEESNIRKRPANEDIEQPSPKRLDQREKQVADVSKSVEDLAARSDRQDMSLEQLRQLERELQEKIQRHDETLMKQLDDMTILKGKISKTESQYTNKSS